MFAFSQVLCNSMKFDIQIPNTQFNGGGSIFTYGTGNLLRPSVLLLGHSKQMPGHYLKLGYDRVPQYTTVYLNIRKCTSIYDRVPRYTTVYLNIRHSSSLLTTRLNF